MRTHIFLLLAPAILLVTSCGSNLGQVNIGSGTRYVNNAGGPQTVSLPDGSNVVLMSGTTFVVSKGFGKDGRDVDIDGEAMFFVKGADVRGAGGKPFVVHTGNLVIEVLDTTGAGGLGAGGSARSGAGGPGAVTGGWGARFAVDAVRKRAGEEADVLDGKLRVMKSYHSDTDNEPEELGAGDMVMINREIDLMEKEKMSGPEEDKVKEKYHIVGQ